MKLSKRLIAAVAACLLGLSPLAGAGEPLSLGALFGPRADAVLRSTVPAAIDIAQKACMATAEDCGIAPVKVADLPESVRRPIETAFPALVAQQANLYFDMPLNDPEMGIGFLNTLGMIAAGGGKVMGMTFGNDVYLACKREDLANSADARSLLGHELVHVAQYQGLGFSEYKELYAKETARKTTYEENILEKEAFGFEHHDPFHPDRAFFAFYRTPKMPERVRVGADGRLVDLESLLAVDTDEVVLTAANEGLARRATLVLGSSDAATGQVAPQILDPHGGEPLHTFGLSGPAHLAANVPAATDGPTLIAIASGTELEIAWRAEGRFHSQRFPVDAQIADVDGDGAVEIVHGGMVRWNWTGSGFEG